MKWRLWTCCLISAAANWGAWGLERRGDIVKVALCLQCSRRDIVQHCVSHNSTSSDIVMSEEMLAVATLSSSEASSEEGGGGEHHNQGRAVAAALVFWGKCHRGFNWPIFHCHPVRRAKGKRGVITWAAALAFNIDQQQLLQKLKISLFNWLVNESDRVGRVKETSLRECPIAYPASPCYFDKCQRLKKEPTGDMDHPYSNHPHPLYFVSSFPFEDKADRQFLD